MEGINSITSLLDGSAVAGVGQRGIVEFVLVLLASMVLGGGYALIYQRYFTGSEVVNESLYRSFVLLSPAVTTIFWVIQFSIPLSLGLDRRALVCPFPHADQAIPRTSPSSCWWLPPAWPARSTSSLSPSGCCWPSGSTP